MPRVRSVSAVLVGMWAAVALGAQPAGAATVYMGPNEPVKTLRQAFKAIKGGDTLIIRDGVYTGRDNMITWSPYNTDFELCPPAGSDGAYTVIRAEHDGQVTFDGAGAYMPISFRYAQSPFHHIEFHGIVYTVPTINSTILRAVYIRADLGTLPSQMSHLKFFRCGFRNGIHLAGTSYVLVEESYAWGQARYLFEASNSDGRGTSKTIFRRCVARPDDVTPYPRGEASAAFMNYSSPEVEYQNCIVLDTDSSKFDSAGNHYGFLQRGKTGMSNPIDIAYRGCMVVKQDGWTRTGDGRYPTAYDFKSTTVGHETVVENSLAWDVMVGAVFSSADNGQAAPGTIRGVTIKLQDDPSYPNTDSGNEAFENYGALTPNWTLRNYLAIGNTPRTATGGALVSGMQSDYGAVFTTAPGPANADWGLYNSAGPGTHDYTQATITYRAGMTHPANNEVNPFTGTPGNGTPALKYIVRVEPGSDLYATGEDGGHRGATVTKRYGVSGSLWGDPGWNTLTDENLWPFPYEAQIRADLRTYRLASDPNFGKRGFAADGQTLTNYIWGYLGHTVPPLGVIPTPGDGSITLTWARPADIALPTIVGFNIYRVEGDQRSLVSTVDGNAIYSATVTGVDPAGSYAFAMTTVDAQKGESGLSEIAVLGTPDTNSGEPTLPPKTTPTISWASPAAITQGTPLGSAQLSASSDVPGTFTYSPAAGTVLAAGTHTLTAFFTPSDATLYTTATAFMSLTVNPAPKTTPVITWPAPAAITQGTALSNIQLTATASVPGTFVYTPAAGTVLATGTHTLNLTFTPADTTRYNTATASTTITVNPAPKTTPVITWPAPAAITQGTALSNTQLTATASVPGTFVYTPAAGTVLATGTHTLNLTFTPADTTRYNTATASTTITVNPAPKTTPVITWSAPAAITQGTALSNTQLTATASVPGAFVYTPAAGTVLATGTHTLSLTFTPADTTRYNTATASTTITVNPAPKTTPVITWPAPAAITQGTALSNTQFTATASVPGTFVYTPAAGTVLATGTHTLSLTFTPADTTRYNTATASTTITVNPAPKTTPVITWPAPAAITQGTALSNTQFTATASVPGTFVYTPAAGTVLATGTHTLSLTFTPADTTRYNTATASTTITVNPAPKTTPVITWPAPAAITQGTALSNTQFTATASVPGAFVYTPAAGTVLATGTHTLNLTFTPADTTRYNTATASTTIVVNPAPKTTPVLTWPAAAAITQGTALSTTQLTATASVPGAFVYAPAAGTVLATGTHTLNLTFTPADTTRYTTATASTTITVNPAPKMTPVITWSAPAAITQGTALSTTQLTATASVPGAFVYTPAAGTVLATGTHTLNLTFTPADTTRYTTATASTTIVVNPAPKTTPVLTWPAPAAITQSTALSDTQLTATASVPGAFVYTPAAGTVLATGTHTLGLTFTPADTTRYTSTTAYTTLTVKALRYSLAVTRPSGGTVNGAGINCGTNGTACSVTMPGALSLGLQATADSGYAFSGWTGDCSGSSPGLTLRLNGVKSCGASFAAVAAGASTGSSTTSGPSASTTNSGVLPIGGPYTLTIVRPSGGVVRAAGIMCGTSVTFCDVTMPAPMTIGIQATANPGYTFLGWTGDCSGTTPNYAMMLEGPRTCGASFVPADGTVVEPTTPSSATTTTTTSTGGTLAVGAPYTLTITRPAGGTVQAAGINCGTTGTNCSVTMPAALWLGLVATPDRGFSFAGWTGSCSGTQPSYSIVLAGARTCSATFTAVQ